MKNEYFALPFTYGKTIKRYNLFHYLNCSLCYGQVLNSQLLVSSHFAYYSTGTLIHWVIYGQSCQIFLFPLLSQLYSVPAVLRGQPVSPLYFLAQVGIHHVLL